MPSQTPTLIGLTARCGFMVSSRRSLMPTRPRSTPLLQPSTLPVSGTSIAPFGVTAPTPTTTFCLGLKGADGTTATKPMHGMGPRMTTYAGLHRLQTFCTGGWNTMPPTSRPSIRNTARRSTIKSIRDRHPSLSRCLTKSPIFQLFINTFNNRGAGEGVHWFINGSPGYGTSGIIDNSMLNFKGYFNEVFPISTKLYVSYSGMSKENFNKVLKGCATTPQSHRICHQWQSRHDHLGCRVRRGGVCILYLLCQQ